MRHTQTSSASKPYSHRSCPPIDFVIPWVDGSDAAWQAERFQYCQEKGDHSSVRFRDWDTLRFWFRGVEVFAPWVNKIHFITWGHLPPWLNTKHPKLHIVRHRDYIPAKYLPTFNSHTIELNMHRIDGLSHQFVYFNDDVFLTAPALPEDFFRHSLPCDTFAQNAIYFGPDSVGLINGSNMAVINKHFSKKEQLRRYWFKWYHPANGLRSLIKTTLLMPWPWFPGFLYSHTACSYLKNTLQELWELESDILDATCMDKFRQPDNVNQWIFKYWQLAKGDFTPSSGKLRHCYHLKESAEAACSAITSQKYGIICINDTKKTVNFEASARQVRQAFQTLFPCRSNYEIF